MDSILAYKPYFHRGTEPGIHDHPWHFYLQRLFAFRPAKGVFWTEGLIGVLAAVGFVAALSADEPAGLVPGLLHAGLDGHLLPPSPTRPRGAC